MAALNSVVDARDKFMGGRHLSLLLLVFVKALASSHTSLLYSVYSVRYPLLWNLGIDSVDACAYYTL